MPQTCRARNASLRGMRSAPLNKGTLHEGLQTEAHLAPTDTARRGRDRHQNRPAGQARIRGDGARVQRVLGPVSGLAGRSRRASAPPPPPPPPLPPRPGPLRHRPPCLAPLPAPPPPGPLF